MKTVILAGGLGSRISEETHLKPKPMIEIGGKPLLWHILKHYSYYGLNEFIICCGYKGDVIKNYFANFLLYNSDVTVNVKDQSLQFHQADKEPWIVTLVDTGNNTATGGRLKRVKNQLEDTAFCMTYGDGLSDINLDSLLDTHRRSGNFATVTAVKSPGRFGALSLAKDGLVTSFHEKPKGDVGLINGGFFVLEPSIFNYIDNDETAWEDTPMKELCMTGCLGSYQHNGFWHPLDTLRDRVYLEELWQSGHPPWKIWA